jgi:hypothetical protein
MSRYPLRTEEGHVCHAAVFSEPFMSSSAFLEDWQVPIYCLPKMGATKRFDAFPRSSFVIYLEAGEFLLVGKRFPIDFRNASDYLLGWVHQKNCQKWNGSYALEWNPLTQNDRLQTKQEMARMYQAREDAIGQDENAVLAREDRPTSWRYSSLRYPILDRQVIGGKTLYCIGYVSPQDDRGSDRIAANHLQRILKESIPQESLDGGRTPCSLPIPEEDASKDLNLLRGWVWEYHPKTNVQQVKVCVLIDKTELTKLNMFLSACQEATTRRTQLIKAERERLIGEAQNQENLLAKVEEERCLRKGPFRFRVRKPVDIAWIRIERDRIERDLGERLSLLEKRRIPLDLMQQIHGQYDAFQKILQEKEEEQRVEPNGTQVQVPRKRWWRVEGSDTEYAWLEAEMFR